MFKRLFFLCASFLFLFSAVVEAGTIRINAPKIQLSLSPGETYSGEIISENPTDAECKVKLYLEDWLYMPGKSGEKKFSPAGSTEFSASKWITFSPTDEIIKPFGRMTVRYTVSVPPDAKGTYVSVLFFETILGSTKDEDGVSVLVAGRVGALIFVETKTGSNREGDIQSVNIKPPAGNAPMEIETTFRNTGNTEVTLGGTFMILDNTGKIYGRGDLNSIYTFPRYIEKGTTQWVGRLPKGIYTVLLTYDLGGSKSLVEEKNLTID